MLNIDYFQYLMPLAGGIFISLFYHTGLWWTVRSLPRSRRPVLLSIGSFYLRMTVTVAAFYIVMQHDWRRLAVCLAGFMVVKFLVTRMIGNATASVTGNRQIHQDYEDKS